MYFFAENFEVVLLKQAEVAQLVESRSFGIISRTQVLYSIKRIQKANAEVAQLVESRSFGIISRTQVLYSIKRIQKANAEVAQLVEQLICNQ